MNTYSTTTPNKRRDMTMTITGPLGSHHDDAQAEQITKTEAQWRRNNDFPLDRDDWTPADHDRYRRIRWVR